MQLRVLQCRTTVVDQLCADVQHLRRLVACRQKSLISVQLRGVPDLYKIKQLTADLKLNDLGFVSLALLGFRRQRVQ